MNFVDSLQSFKQTLSDRDPKEAALSEKQQARLLESGGALPTSSYLRSKLLSAQKADTSSMNDVIAAISGDPVLCMRLIALCNQTYYARGTSITTVESAVNHLGILKVGSIVEEISKKDSYDNALRGRALSLSVFQDVILAGCVARQFFPLFQSGGEGLGLELDRSFLLGCSAAFWRAIYAYNKPDYYSSLMLELLSDSEVTFERQIRKLFKKTMPELGADCFRAAGLPEEFARMIEAFSIPPWNRRSWAMKTDEFTHAHVAAVYTAGRVAHELSLFRGGESLKKLLRDLAQKSGVQEEDVYEKLNGLRDIFCKQLAVLEMTPLRIPDYITQFGELVSDSPSSSSDFQWAQVSTRVDPFLKSLKACFLAASDPQASSRLSQSIYITLLALLRGLNFDRAVFMRFDKTQDALVPVVLLGRPIEYLDSFVRFVSASGNLHMPDVQAFLQKRPIFQGDPVFGDDWPFIAFPIVRNDIAEGVFYADMKASENVEGLPTDEQVAAIALAEEWHHVPDDFH